MHSFIHSIRLWFFCSSAHISDVNPLGRPIENFRCFLNLNLYSNWRFEFEFSFKLGTYILHIPWSQSQTNDLFASVRTFFKKRTPFHLPLSPCKRASYHTYFVAIILSADENDQNKYPSCGKAITTSDSIWENGPLFYCDRYIIYIPPWFCHVRICYLRKKLL